ncbi:hypothetical protein FE257_008808 [Aspergillus nanangensis]|uniref:FAD/NAD(P)-binding domain-containing protein n=1 Tax=Aspergillus nanangensis TaxID=2582783 RepID=A0AAD4GS99_ASPNN|nr:hypothetical protein FE257_008808 [Aspergillus nanangensis]
MGSIEHDKVFHVDAVIVGAGFSGTYGLHKMRQAGLKVKVFEAGSDLGGTWYWNRYPGARVDSEYPYYQLTIPEVYKDFYFSERFPDHREIRRYFAHAEKVLNLKKDIEFNARVNSAVWDEATSLWTIRTEAGHIAVTKYFCMFSGLLHRQYTPKFPGFENYKGVVHHSSAWPEGVDMTGKKVAVVGAGATSVQIVQELSKQADQLAMFMRRPSHCVPMGNRRLNNAEQDAWRPYYKTLFDVGRGSAAGFAIPRQTKNMTDFTEAEREALYEDLWRAGGFHFAAGQFPEIFVDRKANRVAYDFWAKKIRARISDPVKRDLLAPLEPDYPIFTKRYPLEHDYYECLDRENVEVVSLKNTPFKTFTENGVVTEDGKVREFDCVVMATGFESFTGSVATMNIKGKNGVDMYDVWTKGVRTYLGMVTNGFPNCFSAYSPQAPTALSNGPTILECQIDWIIAAINKMEKEGVETLEPSIEAENLWIKSINDAAEPTLFNETDSWWTGANVPGKKREILTYLGGIGAYEAECHSALESWKGFELKQRKSAV